jgi:hypothetical protein
LSVTPTEAISKFEIELQRIVDNGIFPCQESDVPKYVAMHLQRLINGTEIEDPVDKIRQLMKEKMGFFLRSSCLDCGIAGWDDSLGRLYWQFYLAYDGLLAQIDEMCPPKGANRVDSN